jgi:RNA polymerase sigma factor (TIGR02999 family)
MSADSSDNVTELLRAHRAGDPEALERLVSRVYGELRRQAARYLRRERGNHTLQPTALVHEAYLRLADQRDVEWQNRAHFFAIAAQIMRRILVDHARARGRGKRGAGQTLLLFDDALAVAESRDLDLVALDDALGALAKLDERQSRVVEMRFFGGLEVEEVAEALGVSPTTVKRDWSLARAWLQRELRRGGSGR